MIYWPKSWSHPWDSFFFSSRIQSISKSYGFYFLNISCKWNGPFLTTFIANILIRAAFISCLDYSYRLSISFPTPSLIFYRRLSTHQPDWCFKAKTDFESHSLPWLQFSSGFLSHWEWIHFFHGLQGSAWSVPWRPLWAHALLLFFLLLLPIPFTPL